ncbi:hypothetical protein NDN08_001982 [Rhodosorus marinus]|uniref:Cilia- and flagella-associated protein 157 n=1 Tax=Rhodosorus marinus TaxID=101924 RepID=A0AAV8USE9_9RHOD|nr:hypothetical protein NDN08_001982 [Rhodosorus marinus]
MAASDQKLTKEISDGVQSIIGDGFEEIETLLVEAKAKYELDLMQKERAAGKLEKRLIHALSECERLEKQCDQLESEIFDRESSSLDNVEKVEGYKTKLQEMDEKYSAVQARLEVSERERRDSSEAKIRALEALSKAEATISRLSERISQIDECRIAAEENFATATSASFQAKRLEILAAESSSKLKNELMSARAENSQLKTRMATLETEANQTEADSKARVGVLDRKVGFLRQEIQEKDANLEEMQKRSEALKREVSTMKNEKEVNADRWTKEVAQLREISRLRAEALDDAEERLREMASAMEALRAEIVKNEDPYMEIDSGGHGRKRKSAETGEDEPPSIVPPEKVLLVIERELQGRAHELESQAAEYVRAIETEASLRVELEQVKREREAAIVEANACRVAAEKTEQKALEMRRRNNDLERRLLFAADRGNVAISTTPSNTDPPPQTTPRTPSSSAVKAAQVRQEELVTAIVAQRDLYRSMLLNSPFSPGKKT